MLQLSGYCLHSQNMRYKLAGNQTQHVSDATYNIIATTVSKLHTEMIFKNVCINLSQLLPIDPVSEWNLLTAPLSNHDVP